MFYTCVEHTIIQCLSESKHMTVQELYNCATKKGLKVSLPNFYKIVGRLNESNMIIKHHGKFQLHAMYANYLRNIGTNIQKNYIDDSSDKLTNIAPGEYKVFHSSNLQDIGIMQMQLLSELTQLYKGGNAYVYYSHPYLLLSNTEGEKANLYEIGKAVKKSFVVFGNETFLDKYGKELLQLPGYETLCTQAPAFPEEGYFFHSIGDYIIECVLPESISHHYKICFDTAKSMTDFNEEVFSHIPKMRESYTLKLIHSPDHAKKMQQKLEKYFK